MNNHFVYLAKVPSFGLRCPTTCDITKFITPENLFSNHHVFLLKDNQLSDEPSCLKFEKTNNVIGQVL
jgi:hypothetical protein